MSIAELDEALTEREVCGIRKCGRTKLWQDVKEGRFPAPIYYGPRSKRWLKSEIAAHQEELKTARDKA